MPSGTSRRGLLAAVGGVAGTVSLGYVGARVAAREGTVVTRYVFGESLDDGTLTGQTELFEAEVDADGPAERRFHEDYRDAFPDDPPITVSRSLHRDLEREFDRVVYHLGQRCPTGPECSTPRVSRTDFNDAPLGAEVRLLYHGGPWAKLVP